MAWIKIDESCSDHPKIQLVGPLGLALFLRGITYCNRSLTDGRIPTRQALTDAHWCTDRPEVLIASMVEAGLWDKTPDGYAVHDYLDYQFSKQKVLELRAAKQAAGQAGGRASAQAKAQAKSKQNSTPSPSPSPSPSQRPSLSPSQTPKEEEEQAGRSRSENARVVVILPTNRKNQDYEVTEDALEELVPLYPALDVPQQLREMRAWALANPSNRKTARGMPRFIVNWLNGNQNRARGNGSRGLSAADVIGFGDKLKREEAQRG